MPDTSTTIVVPAGRITLLDIAKKNGSDGIVGVIDETIRATPEVMLGAARTVKGLNFKTLIRKSLPSVGFRDANSGGTVSKSVYEQAMIDTFLLNPRIEVDKAVADADEDGPQAAMAMEESAIMAASLHLLGRCFYYGRRTAYAGDAKAFPGLLDFVDPAFVYDAGGTALTLSCGTTNGSTTVTIATTTSLIVGMPVSGAGVPAGATITAIASGVGFTLSAAATATATVTLTFNWATSVWFVAFGQQKCQWVYGQNGQMAFEPVRIESLVDVAGNRFTGYVDEILARPGLQMLNKFSAIRIKNITPQAGHSLTDNILGRAINLLPASMQASITEIFMNTTAREQLRASRTAVNPNGTPAPTPHDWEGIVIAPTDSISKFEGSDIG